MPSLKQIALLALAAMAADRVLGDTATKTPSVSALKTAAELEKIADAAHHRRELLRKKKGRGGKAKAPTFSPTANEYEKVPTSPPTLMLNRGNIEDEYKKVPQPPTWPYTGRDWHNFLIFLVSNEYYDTGISSADIGNALDEYKDSLDGIIDMMRKLGGTQAPTPPPTFLGQTPIVLAVAQPQVPNEVRFKIHSGSKLPVVLDLYDGRQANFWSDYYQITGSNTKVPFPHGPETLWALHLYSSPSRGYAGVYQLSYVETLGNPPRDKFSIITQSNIHVDTITIPPRSEEFEITDTLPRHRRELLTSYEQAPDDPLKVRYVLAKDDKSYENVHGKRDGDDAATGNNDKSSNLRGGNKS